MRLYARLHLLPNVASAHMPPYHHSDNGLKDRRKCRSNYGHAQRMSVNVYLLFWSTATWWLPYPLRPSAHTQSLVA